KIPYSKEKLGLVDPETIRIVEVDLKTRKFQLVVQSGVDLDRNCAYGYIEKPGIYGIIGLPRNTKVLETVKTFVRLWPQIEPAEHRSLQDKICHILLCAQGSLPAQELRGTPSGIAVSVCKFCTNLDIPSDGLPE